MNSSLQVRSVSGSIICRLPREEVSDLSTSELEQHVHDVLQLSSEEDVALTFHEGQILSDEDSLQSLFSHVVQTIEVQAIMQGPIVFSLPKSGVQLPLSRKWAAALKVGELKRRLIERLETRPFGGSLIFCGEKLEDSSLVKDVLPLGESCKVDLDLNDDHLPLMYYYMVVQLPTAGGPAHVLAAGAAPGAPPAIPLPLPGAPPVWGAAAAPPLLGFGGAAHLWVPAGAAGIAAAAGTAAAAAAAGCPLPVTDIAHAWGFGPALGAPAPPPLPAAVPGATGPGGSVQQLGTAVVEADRAAAARASPAELQSLLQKRLTRSLQQR